MRIIVVGEEEFGDILRQGIPHRDITKELKELIDDLGSGHTDAIGAAGVAEKVR